MFRVTVIGGGAAGVLAAAALRARDRSLDVTVVGSQAPFGPGPAYAPGEPRHLCNVTAAKMSAWPDRPDDFVDWCSRNGIAVAPGTFCSRETYGNYLADLLARSGAGQCHGAARRIVSSPAQAVELEDGRSLPSDVVVLAVGRAVTRLPSRLAEAAAWPQRCVVDPWGPGALSALDGMPRRHLTVLGSGLSAIDLSLSQLDNYPAVTMVSRGGALPHVFRAPQELASTPLVTALPRGSSLEAMREAFLAECAAARGCGGWRSVIARLRPSIPSLWQSLSTEDQIEFRTRYLRRWDNLRHQVPPDTHARLRAALRSGRLTVLAAELDGVDLADGALTLQARSGGNRVALRTDALVNATGGLWDATAMASTPVLAALLAKGAASAHPSGVGIRTDQAGRVLDRAGTATDVLALGALRQGESWESTAIPEIRVQAGVLADSARPAHAPAGPGRP